MIMKKSLMNNHSTTNILSSAGVSLAVVNQHASNSLSERILKEIAQYSNSNNNHQLYQDILILCKHLC